MEHNICSIINHSLIHNARNFDMASRLIPDVVTNTMSINRRMTVMKVAVKQS